MDHKTWLWRKKSSEKSIVAADKLDPPPKGNEEEIQIRLPNRAELDNDVKKLNDKLSSVLAECNAKDDLVKEHAKIAKDAIQGREKAEAEAVFIKQELDKALQQRIFGEEQLSHSDAALKECMEQLRFVREEQEQRIHDAVMKASREFEKSQMVLEEELAENNKRLSKLGVENTNLTKALLAKEKLIEDLTNQRTQAEAEFNALLTRLDHTEKENASLKYEVRVLEKELEIRNEEREFDRRTTDASHKQHIENVKKISKLESECQRLRLLVRKRLPGPAALAKMKNEVEVLGRESNDTRKKRLNCSPLGSMVDSAVDISPDELSRRINFLMEQLCTMEEENKVLKDALNKKANELQFSRTMYARAASKLLEVESQLEELSKGHKIMDPTRDSVMSYERSMASLSDIVSNDKFSCAELCASTLVSELEHFRRGKQREPPSCKTVGAFDINLMDDFVEMEKLAIVSVDKPSGISHVSLDRPNAIVGPLEKESGKNLSEVTGREIVQIHDPRSDLGVLNQKIQSSDSLVGQVPSWLQDILKLILEQNRVTQRNPHEILEDIRVALAYKDNPKGNKLVNALEISDDPDLSNSPHFTSATDIDISMTENQQFHSDLSKSIGKVAEIIEGINLPSPAYGILETSSKDGTILSYKSSETSSGYTVRVFQWKTSELSGILLHFIHACYDVLNKKSDFNKFARELSIALEWIMNHCFSLQDVSSMRETIKKHFDWDESRSANEAEVGVISQFAEADGLNSRETLYSLPMVAASNGHNLYQKEELLSNMKEENKKLGDEFSTRKDMEGSLRSATDKNNASMNQLRESEKIISNLQKELETLKEYKDMIQGQVKNHKLLNEDLETQLTVARVELNEAHQQFSSLQVELENKKNCCEELETTCLELQLQLESMTKDEIPNNELKQGEKQIRTDWEITAASEKLAECQETILNLGKQLKALASPREAALFDKVISTRTDSTPTDKINTTAATTPATTLSKNKLNNQRSSLLDQMIAEDSAKGKDLNSPETKGSDGNFNSVIIAKGTVEPLEKILDLDGIKHKNGDSVGNSLAIVPGRKGRSGSLWKRFFLRKRQVHVKKIPLPFAPSQTVM